MTTTQLELGHGDISIGALKADNGKHGVIFMVETETVEIRSVTGGNQRTEMEKRHVCLQITSAKKESIMLLIEKLQESLQHFSA